MPVNELLVIVLLIAASAFFSMSEISLAASRKIKLRLMAEGGHLNAQRVLALQDSPGHFFTVVQIGLNAVTAGMTAPLLWGSTFSLASGMALFAAAGLCAWLLWLRLPAARR